MKAGGKRIRDTGTIRERKKEALILEKRAKAANDTKRQKRQHAKEVRKSIEDHQLLRELREELKALDELNPTGLVETDLDKELEGVIPGEEGLFAEEREVKLPEVELSSEALDSFPEQEVPEIKEGEVPDTIPTRKLP